jgi:hypothetical protein
MVDIPVSPTLMEARSTLEGERVQHLALALNDSFAFLRNLPPQGSSDLDRSAKATIVSRTFYGNAARRLTDDAGVRRGDPRDAQGQHHLIIDEKLVLRGKLFGVSLNTSNYPTVHSSLWDLQGYQLDLLPSVGRLNIGYRPDPTFTFIKDAFITLPYLKNILWVWQIWGEPSDDFGVSIPLYGKNVAPDELYYYTDLSDAGSL